MALEKKVVKSCKIHDGDKGEVKTGAASILHGDLLLSHTGTRKEKGKKEEGWGETTKQDLCSPNTTEGKNRAEEITTKPGARINREKIVRTKEAALWN